jgi:hypothetical protein
MGDIGIERREVEFEPLEEPAAAPEPRVPRPPERAPAEPVRTPA